MSFFNLQPSQSALLVVDMQEKIFAAVKHGAVLLQAVSKLIKGFQILDLPVFVSEQYPQGLGPTLKPLRTLLGDPYRPWIKSTFSCMDDAPFFSHVHALPYSQWIVTGIEAHVCVLQTVKGLIQAGKQVTVAHDATSSRSIHDFSIAIAEMREAGARISCAETILFELLKDSKHPQFKLISSLVKQNCCEGL